MRMGSISRATFAIEAAILTMLAFESLILIARVASNFPAGILFAAYLVLMLAASVSLISIAIDSFQNRRSQRSDRWRIMVWVGFAGALIASVVFALAANFVEHDEGELSIAVVRYLFAPFLFFWIPLGHTWIEGRRAGSLTAQAVSGRSIDQIRPPES
jgi:membrane protease YdiL (CAAX protease family)